MRTAYKVYNGPGTLFLGAEPTADRMSRPPTVATIKVGSRQGIITGDAQTSWNLWWEIGDVTYMVRFEPSEGGTFTLAQFKQELARLTWD